MLHVTSTLQPNRLGFTIERPLRADHHLGSKTWWKRDIINTCCWSYFNNKVVNREKGDYDDPTWLLLSTVLLKYSLLLGNFSADHSVYLVLNEQCWTQPTESGIKAMLCSTQTTRYSIWRIAYNILKITIHIFTHRAGIVAWSFVISLLVPPVSHIPVQVGESLLQRKPASLHASLSGCSPLYFMACET